MRASTSRRYASLFRLASERLLTVEEDERRRVAGELHDGVGQVLTALTLTLDAAAEPTSATAVHERVVAARSLADTALAQTRDLSHRMRPARLEERGLVTAVRDLASAIRLRRDRRRRSRRGRPRACWGQPRRSRSTASSRRRWPTRRATAARAGRAGLDRGTRRRAERGGGRRRTRLRPVGSRRLGHRPGRHGGARAAHRRDARRHHGTRCRDGGQPLAAARPRTMSGRGR